MKKTLTITLAALSVLSGCASTNTGIVEIADNRYMYAKQDWTAHSGGVVKVGMYKEANAFCAAKGKKLVPLESKSQDAVIYQVSAGAEIQFSCQ